MANLPISGLTASAANLAAVDLLPVVQTAGVGPVKMTGQQLAGGLLGSTSITGATVTTSQPLLNLTQTWNAGAVTFTGWKLNVTDTASASASLLMDLQVGGSSKFSVDKTGALTIAGNAVFGSSGTYSQFGNIGINYTASNYINLSSASVIAWGSGSVASASDLILGRNAAASLRLGAADAAAPVAQTLGVQSVVAGTSNTAGVNFTIKGSAGTGTGAGGSIIFQVAPAGSSGTAQNSFVSPWQIQGSTGHFLAGTDNTYDIGASGANRPRNVYVGTSVVTGGQVQAGTFVTAGNASYLGITSKFYMDSASTGVVALRNWAGTDFDRLQFGNTTSSFPALKRVSANLQVIAADGTSSAGLIVGNQALATNATDGFLYIPTCAGTPTGTPTAQTGTAPLVVDSTNNKLYVYVGGAWAAMN